MSTDLQPAEPFDLGEFDLLGFDQGPVVILNTFEMELQKLKNWCWAATALSIGRFHIPGLEMSQCALATAQLSDAEVIEDGTDCCACQGAQDPVSILLPIKSETALPGDVIFPDDPCDCDVPDLLDEPLLFHLDCLAAQIEEALEPEQVIEEINAKRPIGCYIRWQGQRVGHFAVITGYAGAGPEMFLEVQDSYYGTTFLTYLTFRDDYQPAGENGISGAWAETFLTRQPEA